MSDLGQAAELLRPMRESDLEQVLTWRNHSDVRRYMLTQHEISPDEHARWFANTLNEAGRYLLVFELAGNAAGFVHFSGAMRGEAADWGFYAAPDALAGTGRKLGIAALNYAFESIELHKICGQALDFNEPSIRFHRALGFQKEGVLREQCQIADRYHDLICFGLLKSEWLGQQEQNNG